MCRGIHRGIYRGDSYGMSEYRGEKLADVTAY
jgi:hypothetical protein